MPIDWQSTAVRVQSRRSPTSAVGHKRTVFGGVNKRTERKLTRMDSGIANLNLPRGPKYMIWIRAQLGDPRSQLTLAYHSWRDHRGERAIRWARRASSTLPIASVFLANLLRTERGSDASARQEAVALISSAAIAGNAEAQQTLSSYYYFGDGVPRDIGEARRWCAEAARNGRPACWDDLLDNLLHSAEDAPNLAEARRYADMALDAGYPQFYKRVQDFIRDRNCV